LETKVGNYEVSPQALLVIAKSLMNRDGPKAPATVYGPLGIIYHPNEKADVIADCLENQFTSHDLCGKNNEQRMETLLASVGDTPLEKVIPCDMHKLLN
jgi:hypothetical protein